MLHIILFMRNICVQLTHTGVMRHPEASAEGSQTLSDFRWDSSLLEVRLPFAQNDKSYFVKNHSKIS